MPGPVIQSRSFPGMDKLPGPVRALAELIFPPDEVPIDMGMTGAAAPLISIYKSPAARQAATETFRRAAEKMGLGQAGEMFASKYPRVAAHMDLDVPSRRTADYAAITEVPLGKVTDPIPVRFSNIGRAASQADPVNAVENLFHEGTHAAQALGNSDLSALYRHANRSFGGGDIGYALNPFEKTARYAGERAANRFQGTAPPSPPTLMEGGKEVAYTALRGLRNIAAKATERTPSILLKSPKDARRIQDILSDRLTRGNP